MPEDSKLALDDIAAGLEGLEETIIQKLIDRVQFHFNRSVYEPGRSGFPDEPSSSLFKLRLRYQEEMDAVFGRFKVPEERPFHVVLPAARRSYTPSDSPLKISDYNMVNLTPLILEGYLGLVPRICEAGDDGHYGSSAEHDVYALQAVARRIHYGSFYVAESKYRSSPALYRKMIESGDRDGILTALTRPEVEEKILLRVRDKVEKLQSTARSSIRKTLAPEPVRDFYRDTVFPLTKEGEVLYLINRMRDDSAP
jgi:chorismate mutase